LLAGVAVLAGCGGKSGSSTEASSSSQTLKRLEVHVARGASAEAPHRSMLARAADLLGWPQLAEASSGVPGCTVTAGGQSAITDANGDATLTGVTFPTTVVVSGCPGGLPTGSFPVTGAQGAIVHVEVEVGGIEVKVKDQHVSAPSQPSEPSQPSQPSQPQS
jgi:hypothetical protein